jgi:hypothetical protein
MRLIPRRKRTWLLVLLGVAVVGAAAVWWAASEKSNFEQEFDRLRIGMSIPKALALMAADGGSVDTVAQGPLSYTRFGWINDGEHITLVFKNEKLAENEFKQSGIRHRLRRLWTRCFQSQPTF